MNILHATTGPTLLARPKEMLGSSARADIAVGYFFIGGFTCASPALARAEWPLPDQHYYVAVGRDKLAGIALDE